MSACAKYGPPAPPTHFQLSDTNEARHAAPDYSVTPIMHIETITLDQVFDVQRKEASRNSPRRTDFSFESNGARHYAVSVPGWPGIEPGSSLTVVLRKAGNWQTLAGWKNHSNGEVVLPDAKRSLYGAGQGLFLTVLGCFFFSMSTTVTGRILSACMLVFCLLMAVEDVLQWRRKRAQALVIRRADPLPQPTTCGRN